MPPPCSGCWPTDPQVQPTEHTDFGENLSTPSKAIAELTDMQNGHFDWF